MNQMINMGDMPLTMSSREIAELTGKEHKHVMRDIRVLQEQLGDMFGGVVQNWTHPQNGQTYEEFTLDKDTCLTLLLGYDAVARMKVVKRWQELEAGAQPPAMINLRDPKQLAAAALQLIEVNQELQEKVESMSLTVAAHERLVKSDGSICITNAAKELQMRPKDLFAKLSQDKWIFKRHGGSPWLGYQDKIQQGLLEMKVYTTERSDGTEKMVESVLVTPKGLAKLARDLSLQ